MKGFLAGIILIAVCLTLASEAYIQVEKTLNKHNRMDQINLILNQKGK